MQRSLKKQFIRNVINRSPNEKFTGFKEKVIDFQSFDK